MIQKLMTSGLCIAMLFGAVGMAQAARDLTVKPKVAAGSIHMGGEYWALIIGIDKYQHAPKLESAVKDAKGVRDVLRERYGFQKDRIIELFNEQATGPKIQNALYQLGRQAGKEDSVFIYFAGHGQYDEEGRLGWWVPVEAQPKNPGTFIMDSSVLSFVKGMKAKHVYLVADSCFSGTLFGTRALPPLNDKFFAQMYGKSSRWGLTSGGTEPVADQGKNGHSIFAYHLINLLKDNTDPYLVPSHIYDQLAPLITNNSDQTPRSEPLKGAGDEGGQFVFRLASVSGGPLPQPPGTGGGLGVDALAEERKKLESERAQLQADRETIEQARQQAEERAKLAAEREKLEAERKQLKMAKVPAYDPPRQHGRSIVGKVQYNGRPEQKLFTFSKFPNPIFCRESTPLELRDGDSLVLKTIDLGPNRGLKGAIVAVTDIEDPLFVDGYQGTHVVMEGCNYNPFTGVIVNGKNVHIENRDADPNNDKFVAGVYHQVHSFEAQGGSLRAASLRTMFNIAMARKGDLLIRPVKIGNGSIFKLGCDFHEYQQAYFLPVTNPYYAKVQDDGSFEIKGVPLGRHRLVAWHPFAGRMEVDIYVEDSGATQVNLEIPAL